MDHRSATPTILASAALIVSLIALFVAMKKSPTPGNNQTPASATAHHETAAPESSGHVNTGSGHGSAPALQPSVGEALPAARERASAVAGNTAETRADPGQATTGRAVAAQPPSPTPSPDRRAQEPDQAAQQEASDAAEAARPNPMEGVREGVSEALARRRQGIVDCYEALLEEYPDLADDLTFEIEVSREAGAGPEGQDIGRANLASIVNYEFNIEELECFHEAMDGFEMPLPNEGTYTIREAVFYATGGGVRFDLHTK